MRSFVTYLAFRLGAGLLGLLPIRLAQGLGEIAGRLGYHLAPGRRHATLLHAARLGSEQPEIHARRVFEGYGRYWAEAFWVRPHRIPEMVKRIEIEGIEHVRRAHAAGTGAICAVPHLGNWEVAGPVAVGEGFELVAVAEDLPNRWIRDWFIRLRNRLGIGIILVRRNGASVVRQLEEAIARNAVVALLCDRDLRGRGVAVTFFGEETTLPSGPVRLSLRSGAPILPVAVYFRPDGGHLIRILPPLDVTDTGDRSSDLARGTQQVADALELLIRQAPQQWHLLQPNWPSDRRALGIDDPSTEAR